MSTALPSSLQSKLSPILHNHFAQLLSPYPLLHASSMNNLAPHQQTAYDSLASPSHLGNVISVLSANRLALHFLLSPIALHRNLLASIWIIVVPSHPLLLETRFTPSFSSMNLPACLGHTAYMTNLLLLLYRSSSNGNLWLKTKPEQLSKSFEPTKLKNSPASTLSHHSYNPPALSTKQPPPIPPRPTAWLNASIALSSTWSDLCSYIPNYLHHSGPKLSKLPTRSATAFLLDLFTTISHRTKPGSVLHPLSLTFANLDALHSPAFQQKYLPPATKSHPDQFNAVSSVISETKSIDSGTLSPNESSSQAMLSSKKTNFFLSQPFLTFPNLLQPFIHHSPTMSSTMTIAIQKNSLFQSIHHALNIYLCLHLNCLLLLLLETF